MKINFRNLKKPVWDREYFTSEPDILVDYFQREVMKLGRPESVITKEQARRIKVLLEKLNTSREVNEMYLTLEGEIRVTMRPRRAPKWLRYLKSLSYVVPQACREEMVADLSAMYRDMREEGLWKPWIVLVITANVLTVMFHGYKFKLTNYFYKPAKIQKSD